MYPENQDTSIELIGTGWEKPDGVACVFALSDRAMEARGPVVFVPGDRRVLVRTLPPGQYQVLVDGPRTGPQPVMVYQHVSSSLREAVVLDQPSTPLSSVRWVWITVPVRKLDPKLKFSVRIEKAP
jgi:hypothetical protein